MVPFVCADDTQKKSQIDSLLANAAVANLRAQDSRPFLLRLEIHVTHLSTKPLDGLYDEIWRSPSTWQRQISFPGFARRRSATARAVGWPAIWISDHTPYICYLARWRQSPFLSSPMNKSRRFRPEEDGLELHCADFKRGTLERTLCFNSAGPMVSDEYNEFDGRRLRVEYIDFQKFGEKLFPRQMRVYQNEEQVLEVKVVALDQLTDATPAHFDHAANAHLISVLRQVGGTPSQKSNAAISSRSAKKSPNGAPLLCTRPCGGWFCGSVEIVG